MGIGDRVRVWADQTASGFADRLATWGLGMISRGVRKTLDDLEPGMIDQMRETLTSIRDNPSTPPEYRRFINKSLTEGNIGEVIAGWLFSILGFIPALLGGGAPIGRAMEYQVDYVWRSHLLDPISVITAWRRDPETYEKYFEDLRMQGWSDERIDALKFFTQYLPSPQQVIAWLAHEVFEPEMIARYGLDDEFGGLDLTIPRKIGMTDEMSLNEWRNHWQHASWNQVVEMLHRGQLTEDEVWEWFRLVEIPPYWRDKLINISWVVPTRVDVRRFWDMRTIDEARLREIYTAQGYHGKDLEDYVLWTKIYVDFPDLMTRYKNGWLTLEDVRAELIKLGMSADRAEELIQTKVKATTSEKLAKEKDLTMSQIVKGVKKAVITRDEGLLLLQDMGYDPYEAAYILAIEIPQDEVVTEVKIRELTKSDILNGLKAGIITEDEALDRLLSLRYLLDDARFILDIFKATVEPPTEPRLREASKADIVKAVKTGLITPEDAYLMLQDIGFSPEASEFILMVHAEESPFSPMSYNEFKDLTDKFRQVRGRGAAEMTEELGTLANQVIELTRDRDNIREQLDRKEADIVDEDSLPAEARDELNALRTTLLRTGAELERVKAEYQRQLSIWRQRSTK